VDGAQASDELFVATSADVISWTFCCGVESLIFEIVVPAGSVAGIGVAGIEEELVSWDGAVSDESSSLGGSGLPDTAISADGGTSTTISIRSEG
jgi:hypothetical protein